MTIGSYNSDFEIKLEKGPFWHRTEDKIFTRVK